MKNGRKECRSWGERIGAYGLRGQRRGMMKTRMGMGNGDVDTAATNWRKGEGNWVGRGRQKKKTTTGGKMGNERANKTIRKSKNRTKKLTSYS